MNRNIFCIFGLQLANQTNKLIFCQKQIEVKQ